jgi:hypothetical protein
MGNEPRVRLEPTYIYMYVDSLGCVWFSCGLLKI